MTDDDRELTTRAFLAAVEELNRRCRHGHLPRFHDGFAQYASTWWCDEWARLVGRQRQWRRRNLYDDDDTEQQQPRRRGWPFVDDGGDAA